VPEAALDRFLVRVELGYPDAEAELELYAGNDAEQRLTQVAPVLRLTELMALQARCKDVRVGEPIAEYALRVVTATRVHRDVQLGASPRAALAWLDTARARALLDGRDYVLPDDLEALAVPALAHRVFLRRNEDAAALVHDIVQNTEVPL
jgi:MoxR-like ATPase